MSGVAVGTQFGFALGGFAPAIAAALAGPGLQSWVPVADIRQCDRCGRRDRRGVHARNLQDAPQRPGEADSADQPGLSTAVCDAQVQPGSPGVNQPM